MRYSPLLFVALLVLVACGWAEGDGERSHDLEDGENRSVLSILLIRVLMEAVDRVDVER